MNIHGIERRATRQYDTPARSPVERACDLATTLAECTGVYGEYADQGDVIVWREPSLVRSVAYCPGAKTVVFRPGADVDHEPMTVACELVAGVETYYIEELI